MGRALSLPTFNRIDYAFNSNHPWLAKLIRWPYHRMVRKIQRKYLNGQRNAERFARFKVYRLLLLGMPEQ